MRSLSTRTFLLFIAALLLSATIYSCSRDEEPEEQKKEKDNHVVGDWDVVDMNGNATMESSAMRFMVGDSLHVVQEGMTRATTTVAGVTTFTENDIVTISVESSYQDSVAKNYIVAANGTDLSYAGTTATNEFHWESSVENIKLRAWSYGKGMDADKYNTAQASPNNVTYNLPTNQTSGYGELLYCAKEISYLTANAAGGIALDMHHQLARIIVKLKRKAADDTSDIESVTIGDGSVSIPTSATFVMPETFTQQTGEWKDITKTTTAITCHEDTPTSDDTAAGIEAVYSAVVIPDTYASGINLIQVTMSDGNKYNYATTAATPLSASNQYIYTITIGDDVATLQATYPTEWTASGFPITEYDTSKSFGVYVYNGSTAVYSNIEMPAKAAGSTVTLDAGSFRPHLSTSYTYYIYYPYTDSPGEVDEEATSAEAFFTGLMSSWETSTSQGAEDKSALRSNDLQMGMISPTAAGNRKNQTRTATMAHKMGLARFTLTQSTNVPTTINYLNNVESSRTGSNTVTASNSFSGFTPFNNSGTYLYLIRPATETTLNSNSGTDQWVTSLTYNIPIGGTAIQSAKSRRWKFTNSATWNYSYTANSVYTLSVPCGGDYKLEVWGAGSDYSDGSYGGYAFGTIPLSANKSLYICVGAHGYAPGTSANASSSPYNGGGVTGPYGVSGGGATHIAWNQNLGELKNYVNAQSDVLIVAGGGGGTDGSVSGGGGHGGGTNGTKGTSTSGWAAAEPGTQTDGGAGARNYSTGTSGSKGTFGQGGAAGYYNTSGNTLDHGSGGGGGWYGGGGTQYAGAGGGGSGHLHQSLSDYGMENGVAKTNERDGYATISVTL